MTYFVKVGAFQENKSGVGSRGYQLFRRGKYIVTRWGGIEVTPDRRFYWCYLPREKKYRFGSERAAREARKKFIAHRIENEGYSQLPVGAKIEV